MIKDELMHHGVKGQKWGVRKQANYHVGGLVKRDDGKYYDINATVNKKNFKKFNRLSDTKNQGKYTIDYILQNKIKTKTYEEIALSEKDLKERQQFMNNLMSGFFDVDENGKLFPKHKE